MKKVAKPSGANYPPYFQRYLDLVPDDGNLLQHLKTLQTETKDLIGSLTDEQLLYRYADGKWTIKEILVHLMDAERIFAYRALRLARHDQTPLPGFEEDDYVPVSGANARSGADILREMAAVRQASVALIKGLPRQTAKLEGNVSNSRMSVAGILNLIAGHHRHHLNVIKARYLKG